jgi:hypothetical protein
VVVIYGGLILAALSWITGRDPPPPQDPPGIAGEPAPGPQNGPPN